MWQLAHRCGGTRGRRVERLAPSTHDGTALASAALALPGWSPNASHLLATWSPSIKCVPAASEPSVLVVWLLVRGGQAGDVHRKMKDQLSVAHFVAGPRSQELRCSRAHCAWRVALRFSISVPCRSQSHRTSPLTSISARRRRRRGPDLARGWMASMAQGARGCGWSKHESGPHRHPLQLLCLHQVPPCATSRERVQLT